MELINTEGSGTSFRLAPSLKALSPVIVKLFPGLIHVPGKQDLLAVSSLIYPSIGYSLK